MKSNYRAQIEKPAYAPARVGLKNGMSAPVAIRDQIVPVKSGQTLFDVLRLLEVDAIEILVDINGFAPFVRCGEGTTVSVNDPASTDELKSRLEAENVRVAALLVSTDFCADNANAHVAWAALVARAAGQLGAPALRVDSWTAKPSMTSTQVCDNLIAKIRELLVQTADTGVDLGIENHGPFSNEERFLDAVFDAIPDPRLGLTLDTGNFYWWGYPLDDVYRLIEKYAPKAKHTHIKNINYPSDLARQKRPVGHEYKQFCCPLDEGNLDLKRVAQILRAGGYGRDLCIEDESLFKFPEEHKVQVLRRDVQAMKQSING